MRCLKLDYLLASLENMSALVIIYLVQVRKASDTTARRMKWYNRSLWVLIRVAEMHFEVCGKRGCKTGLWTV